jgi:hypothetical protein
MLFLSGDENGGFDGHSIFYDEENPDAYKDLGKPLAKNMYQPFLTRSVALAILKALFLGPDTNRDAVASEVAKKPKTEEGK